MVSVDFFKVERKPYIFFFQMIEVFGHQLIYNKGAKRFFIFGRSNRFFELSQKNYQKSIQKTFVRIVNLWQLASGLIRPWQIH